MHTLQSDGNTDRLDTGVQQVADSQYQQYSVIQLDDDLLLLVVMRAVDSIPSAYFLDNF